MNGWPLVDGSLNHAGAFARLRLRCTYIYFFWKVCAPPVRRFTYNVSGFYSSSNRRGQSGPTSVYRFYCLHGSGANIWPGLSRQPGALHASAPQCRRERRAFHALELAADTRPPTPRKFKRKSVRLVGENKTLCHCMACYFGPPAMRRYCL